MRENNEAEFIPRFKVGDKVEIKATGEQGEIIKNEAIENAQTDKKSPTEWHEVRPENGSSVQRCHENELRRYRPE